MIVTSVIVIVISNRKILSYWLILISSIKQISFLLLNIPTFFHSELDEIEDCSTIKYYIELVSKFILLTKYGLTSKNAFLEYMISWCFYYVPLLDFSLYWYFNDVSLLENML